MMCETYHHKPCEGTPSNLNCVTDSHHLGILYASFKIDKMPKLCVIKLTKIKDIPCTNPYKYCKVVELIYEVHKVNRKELTELACRSTHTIKARPSKVPENDNLYALFLKYTKYDITFMHNWLKTFMLPNRHNFEIRATKYLASKVLSYDNWTGSISDGRKRDILALYGLCLLFSKHVLLHLHNDLVWTMMETLSENHQNDLEKV